jgi:hypothetical protein
LAGEHCFAHLVPGLISNLEEVIGLLVLVVAYFTYGLNLTAE